MTATISSDQLSNDPLSNGQLSDLVRDLGQQPDSSAVLQQLTHWAVQTIPGARHACVSLTQRRRAITCAGATSDLAHHFTTLQQALGQGPSLEAMYEHRTVRVHDLAHEDRWPALARCWADVGARSILSLQLFVHGRDLGALTVLSEQPGTFDEDSERWGLLVAAYAAVAVATAATIEGLSAANANRTVIGQAVGILTERLKVSPEVAFTMLTRISQNINRKLFQVAEHLVTTGEVPTSSPRR